MLLSQQSQERNIISFLTCSLQKDQRRMLFPKQRGYISCRYVWMVSHLFQISARVNLLWGILCKCFTNELVKIQATRTAAFTISQLYLFIILPCIQQSFILSWAHSKRGLKLVSQRFKLKGRKPMRNQQGSCLGLFLPMNSNSDVYLASAFKQTSKEIRQMEKEIRNEHSAKFGVGLSVIEQEFSQLSALLPSCSYIKLSRT